MDVKIQTKVQHKQFRMWILHFKSVLCCLTNNRN